MSKWPIEESNINEIKDDIKKKLDITEEDASNLVFVGSESNEMYNITKDEIMVRLKNGKVLPFSQVSDYPIGNTVVQKYFYVILNFHTLQKFK